MRWVALFLLILPLAVPGVCQNDPVTPVNYIKVYEKKVVDWKTLTGKATLTAGWILGKEHCINALRSQGYKQNFARDFEKRVRYIEVNFVGSHPMAAGAVYMTILPDFIYLSRYWLLGYSYREFAGVIVHEYVHTLQGDKLRDMGATPDSEIEEDLMDFFEQQASAMEKVCMGMPPEE